MAFNCQYAIDRGVKCKAWTTSDAVYCDAHQKALDNIDTLEREVLAILQEAREKKSGEL